MPLLRHFLDATEEARSRGEFADMVLSGVLDV